MSPSETSSADSTENARRKQQQQNGVEANRSAFIRSSQTRHSADQYLPMVSPNTKISVCSNISLLTFQYFNMICLKRTENKLPWMIELGLDNLPRLVEF